MATIDQRFICTSDLDTYYVDNASGLPMSGGIVTFYSDVNRTVLKPVYQLTGTPGSYSYAPLNNPCTLSSSGTFQDALGNNIVPYYYPFTGLPTDNGGVGSGVQELYYITVVNSGFVPQFVRQGWPQSAAGGSNVVTEAELINFIPNGQFLANNNAIAGLAPNVQPYVQYMLGSTTVDAQPIAQGGWNFLYTDGTTATFKNSFSLIPNSGGYTGITSFPRYAFNFQCLSIGDTPTYRDLQISWPDTYKFSAAVVNGVYPTYNLFFNAKSNDGNTYIFTLSILWYLGGNQTPVTIPIGTISIGSSSYSNYNFPITFPTPAGSLSGNNDDYVAIDIRGPTTPWNVSFTDFVLYEGDTALTSFPTATNAEMLSEGVAGWMPTPNPAGQDLYLPLILTPQGMTFDHSQVGTVVGKMTTTAINNELLCDGTAYVTSAYSALGIPYSRLFNVLYNSTQQMSIFGTGNISANCYISSAATSELILVTNIAGSQTNPTDGATSTAFTFNSSYNTGGMTTNYHSGSNSSGIITFISNFTSGTHSGNAFSAGTSGMSFSSLSNPAIASGYYAGSTTALSASALAAGGGMPGLYFTFSDHTTDYYVWFKVSTETDPAPGGTGIEINLVSTMTAVDVGNIITSVFNGFQTNTITTVAATNPIPAGAYFTYFAGSSNYKYVVWYQVANAGTQPVIATTQDYIKVVLTGTETAAQVATKTQKAINAYSFAVPNLQGLILRGVDGTAGWSSPYWDLDVSQRFSDNFSGGANNYSSPSIIGSLEFDGFTAHKHTGSTANVDTNTTIAGSGEVSAYNATVGSTSNILSIATDGGSETRPANAFVNWFIKY